MVRHDAPDSGTPNSRVNNATKMTPHDYGKIEISGSEGVLVDFVKVMTARGIEHAVARLKSMTDHKSKRKNSTPGWLAVATRAPDNQMHFKAQERLRREGHQLPITSTALGKCI